MEVKAKLRYLKIAPRKVRLVIDLVRNLSIDEARNQLKFTQKKSSKSLLKLLESAIANAKNNFNLKEENLYIKKFIADEGPKLKRWRPRAFGRATQILKRVSHVTLILDEKNKESQKKSSLKEKNNKKLKTDDKKVKERKK